MSSGNSLVGQSIVLDTTSVMVAQAVDTAEVKVEVIEKVSEEQANLVVDHAIVHMNPNADLIIGAIVGFSLAYAVFLVAFSEKVQHFIHRGEEIKK